MAKPDKGTHWTADESPKWVSFNGHFQTVCVVWPLMRYSGRNVNYSTDDFILGFSWLYTVFHTKRACIKKNDEDNGERNSFV